MERVLSHFVAWVYDIRNWWVQCRLAQDTVGRQAKVRAWETVTGQRELGDFCLTDQMQLLTPEGWAHV